MSLRCSIKKLSLKISQNSLEKNNARAFFNKIATCNFTKREPLAQVFSCRATFLEQPLRNTSRRLLLNASQYS